MPNRRTLAMAALLIAAGLALAAALDPRSAQLLANTLCLAAAAAAIATPCGAWLGLLLGRSDLPLRPFVAWCVLWSASVPLYLWTAAWEAGLGPQGWLTGSVPEFLRLTGWRGAILVHAAAGTPWVALLVAVAGRYADPSAEEATLLDASPPRVLCSTTARYAWPAMLLGAGWVALTAATEIAATDLFQVRTYAEELYTELALGTDLDRAAVRWWPGVVTTAGATLLAFWLAARLLPPTPADAPPARPLPLRGARWPLLLSAGVLLALQSGGPLVHLLYKTGQQLVPQEAGVARSWSAVKTVQILAASPGRFARECGWSFALGAAAALSALVVAIGCAWAARRRRAVRAVVLVAAACAAGLPAPVLGTLVIAVLNRPALAYVYDHTAAAVWFVQTVRAFPPVLLLVWHALASVPRESLDTAELEGASRLQQLLLIVLPQRRAALLAAAAAGFLAASGEVGATILVAPPGLETLPIRLFGLMHFGYAEDYLAGMCLAWSLLLLVPAGLCVWRVGRR